MIFFALFTAWAIAVIFYFSKINRIARSYKRPVFSSSRGYTKSIRRLLRSLYGRILLATIMYIIALALVYFGFTSG